MLTERPDIVIALPPKRNRHKAKAADMKVPVIVEARDPRRIRRKPALTRTVIDGPDVSEDDLRQRGDAADGLWQDLKRREIALVSGGPRGAIKSLVRSQT